MRTLKILFVTAFFLAPLSPWISTRVATLTAIFLPTTSSEVGAESVPQSKQAKPVDASQFVGSDSCAECHGGEATHYALTAHAKTKVGNTPVDKHGCEACHGPARGHLDFYLGIQKLNEAGKEAEATTLMNDTAKAAAAKLSSFKEMSAAQSTAICLSRIPSHFHCTTILFSYLDYWKDMASVLQVTRHSYGSFQ